MLHIQWHHLCVCAKNKTHCNSRKRPEGDTAYRSRSRCLKDLSIIFLFPLTVSLFPVDILLIPLGINSLPVSEGTEKPPVFVCIFHCVRKEQRERQVTLHTRQQGYLKPKKSWHILDDISRMTVTLFQVSATGIRRNSAAAFFTQITLTISVWKEIPQHPYQPLQQGSVSTYSVSPG